MTESDKQKAFDSLWDTWSFVSGSDYSAQVFDLFCKSIYPVDLRYRGVIYDIVKSMGVKPSKDDPALISYYATPEKKDAGVRTKTKPGKLLRKINPWATDKEVSEFSDRYRAMFAPKLYDIIDSKGESDFIKAYTGEIVNANPSLENTDSGFEVKSLSGSCMRKRFSFTHPAAAYASGDFRIVYAIEKGTGLIGARVVVCKNNTAAPIYTNCDWATKALDDYLTEKNTNPDSNWQGLSLKKIPACGDDTAMCPYIDGYNTVEDCGDCLSIDTGGIGFGTGGYVTLVAMGWCESCEGSYPEYDITTVYNEVCVCRGCRGNYYKYSELMDEYIPYSDCVFVEATVATQDWIDNNGYVYCSASDEYREESDCIEYDGEFYAIDSSVVFYVEGKYYHEDSQEYTDAIEEQERKKKLKNLVYETIITESFNYSSKAMESFPWLIKYSPDFVKQEETKLRQNYELDDNGIPTRLPELDLGLLDITAELVQA
jgi:hypothetical protein